MLLSKKRGWGKLAGAFVAFGVWRLLLLYPHFLFPAAYPLVVGSQHAGQLLAVGAAAAVALPEAGLLVGHGVLPRGVLLGLGGQRRVDGGRVDEGLGPVHPNALVRRVGRVQRRRPWAAELLAFGRLAGEELVLAAQESDQDEDED